MASIYIPDSMRDKWDELRSDSDFLGDFRSAVRCSAKDQRQVIRDHLETLTGNIGQIATRERLRLALLQFLNLDVPAIWDHATLGAPPLDLFGPTITNDLNVTGSISTTKDTTMNASITIKTVTYVNGRDVDSLSTDDVLTLIANAEGRIKQLTALDSKPAAAVKEADALKDSIAQLVELVDARDAAKA